MIAERLRKAVLQAAIQGKLTEQLPEDGDARDLLAEIGVEKERLIQEGKIKRQQPLPEIMEDEIPFEIPENWCWVRLGEVFHLKAGKFISASEIFQEPADGLFPCFGGNGQRGFVNRYNREGSYPLVGRQGALCGNINLANGKFYATEHAVAVDVFGGCSSYWAAVFLKALNLNQYATSTAQPGIAVGTINKVLLPLPTLVEQQRIVAKLEELLPQIDKLQAEEEALAKLQSEFPQTLKNSLLQAAIQGSLTEQLPEDGDARELLAEIEAEKERLIKEGKVRKPKPLPIIVEDEIPFEIPENWCWCHLGQLCEIIGGTSYSTSNIANKGVRILRGGNIIDRTNRILLHDDDVTVDARLLDESKVVYKGDIVIVASTGSSAVIGKPAFSHHDMPSTQIGAFLRIVRVSNEKMVPYVQALFRSEFYRKYIRECVQGTNIFNIRAGHLLDWQIPIPPFCEQQRIVAKLEELLPLCDALEIG